MFLSFLLEIAWDHSMSIRDWILEINFAYGRCVNASRHSSLIFSKNFKMVCSQCLPTGKGFWYFDKLYFKAVKRIHSSHNLRAYNYCVI